MPRSGSKKVPRQTASGAASAIEDEDARAGIDSHSSVALGSASLTTVPPATPDTKRRSTSRSGTLDSFATPDAKKQRRVTPAVTPEEESSDHNALSRYVPEYIHKNLDYKKRGEKTLSATTSEVYRLVCEHYEIPDNFEQRRSFGPLSGTSYEERVVQAYAVGRLASSRKDGDAPAAEICTCCAALGHKRVDCPTLI